MIAIIIPGTKENNVLLSQSERFQRIAWFEAWLESIQINGCTFLYGHGIWERVREPIALALIIDNGLYSHDQWFQFGAYLRKAWKQTSLLMFIRSIQPTFV